MFSSSSSSSNETPSAVNVTVTNASMADILKKARLAFTMRSVLGFATDKVASSAILTTIPDFYFRGMVQSGYGLSLPPVGQYATGIVVFSQNTYNESKEKVEELVESAGLEVLLWTKPTTKSIASNNEKTEPLIRQVFLTGEAAGKDSSSFANDVSKLYQDAVSNSRTTNGEYEIWSLSSTTITYKGNEAAHQLFKTYVDLMQPEFYARMVLMCEVSETCHTQVQVFRASHSHGTSGDGDSARGSPTEMDTTSPSDENSHVATFLSSKLDRESSHQNMCGSVNLDSWNSTDLELFFDISKDVFTLNAKGLRPMKIGAEQSMDLLPEKSTVMLSDADYLDEKTVTSLQKMLLECSTPSGMPILAIISGKLDDAYHVLRAYQFFISNGYHSSLIESINSTTDVSTIGQEKYSVPTQYFPDEQYQKAALMVNGMFFGHQIRRTFWDVLAIEKKTAELNTLTTKFDLSSKLVKENEIITNFKPILKRDAKRDDLINGVFGESLLPQLRDVVHYYEDVSDMIKALEKFETFIKCLIKSPSSPLDERVSLYFMDVQSIVAQWNEIALECALKLKNAISQILTLVLSDINCLEKYNEDVDNLSNSDDEDEGYSRDSISPPSPEEEKSDDSELLEEQ